MILKSDQIANRLALTDEVHRKDPLVVTPLPDLDKLRKKGSASIDLRLGTWFLTMRQSRACLLDGNEQLKRAAADAQIQPAQLDTLRSCLTGIANSQLELTKSHYVRFGDSFLLHPRNFVLGVTLEWIRLPGDLAGYVIGRSSWGRRGLIIATAVGVHPGFTGCLTLELTNLGEIPIAIHPGDSICQLFLHSVHSGTSAIDETPLALSRKPILGSMGGDPIADKLRRGSI